MRQLNAVLIAATVSGLTAGCSLEKQSAPAFTGPSEFGNINDPRRVTPLSVTVTATPNELPRDGRSEAVIIATVRDLSGNPVVGERLRFTPSVGSVSPDEVTTESDGRASVTYVAPPTSTVAGNTATIQVQPLSSNAAVVGTASIRLTGVANTTAPTPDFAFSPSAPVLRETVAFDASDTTDEGVKCNDACTYAWDFDGEGTASGRRVTHQFLAVRTYPVKLTVTDAAGVTASLSKNVAVTQGSAPTASFEFSPTTPQILETVNFTAAGSTVGQAGRTIVSYEWNFGDGNTASGVTTSHTYQLTGTYPVALTVTDSAGIKATKTNSITVVNTGITAAFTVSPTDPKLNATVIVNASTSTSRDEIRKYIWNFGKGTGTTETTDPITSTSYSTAGTYTINLTVEDIKGRQASTSKTIKVE